MDRRTRPTDARRRIACALLLALSLAGCGGNSYVSLSSGGPLPAVTANSTAVSFQSSAYSTSPYFLLAMMFLIGNAWEYSDQAYRVYGGYPSAMPPMDESRKVNMQDCGKPIEDWSANLKCR